MRSTIIFAISGALAGLAIGLVLTGIATPSYDSYLMDINQYQELQKMQNLIVFFDGNMIAIVYLLFLASVSLTWFQIAGVLNSHLAGFPFRKLESPLKAWSLVIISGMIFWGALLGIGDLVESIGSVSFYNYVEILFAVVGCGLAWLIISEKGLGELSIGTLSRNWKQYATVLGQGMLFSVFCVAIFFLAMRELFSVLMIVVVEVFDPSMEASIFGYMWLLSLLVVLMGVSFMISFGLAPLFKSPWNEVKNTISQCRPAISVLAIAVVAVIVCAPIFYNKFHYKYDNLLEAADLNSLPPYKFKLVQFCHKDTRSCKNQQHKGKLSTAYKTSDWETTVDGFSMFLSDNKIPLNEGVVKKLESYILGEGEYSIYRKLALNVLPNVYRKLWHPNQAMHAYDHVAKEGVLPLGPQIIWPMLHLRWLESSAPVSEQNRKDLEKLSDPNLYYYGARYAMHLGNAWRRFGVPEKANHFYRLAEKNADQVETQNMPKKITQSTFLNGKIQGVVKMDQNKSTGIRVGLFIMEDDAKAGNINPNKYQNIVDSVLLKDNGKFVFSDLTRGDYYLALLLPEKLIDKNTVIVSRIQPVISINKTSRRYNAGDIRIQ